LFARVLSSFLFRSLVCVLYCWRYIKHLCKIHGFVLTQAVSPAFVVYPTCERTARAPLYMHDGFLFLFPDSYVYELPFSVLVFCLVYLRAAVFSSCFLSCTFACYRFLFMFSVLHICVLPFSVHVFFHIYLCTTGFCSGVFYLCLYCLFKNDCMRAR